MSHDDSYLDLYEVYEELFDPMLTDRQARRQRKPQARHQPKKAQVQVVAELADDMVGLEGGFETTYQPSRHEEEWLLSSVRTFYDQGLINDVLALIKGGKEASVYRCAADPATGASVLAAKVYRPRKFRNLRNDSLYRQGRAILDYRGSDHDTARDDRIARAIHKKTEFGRQVQHTSWLMHEYTAMDKLYHAGGAAPQPVAAGENAILMSYHGNGAVAAPTLSQISLRRDEAQALFREVRRNVELMLQHGLIHGDLSAFNILYWQGEIIIIDFPQVINLHSNDNAYAILQRDVRRVCEYFGKYGVDCDPGDVMDELWYQYGYGE